MLSFRSTTGVLVWAGILVCWPPQPKRKPIAMATGSTTPATSPAAPIATQAPTCNRTTKTVQWRKQVENEPHDGRQWTL